MMQVKKPYLFMLLLSTLFIFGCASGGVKTDVHSADLSQYESFFIEAVKVYSNEPSARDNVPLQKKMKSWESFTRNELEAYVEESHYTLIHAVKTQSGKSLTAEVDVNVTYGNRALRALVGFGAGQGGINSTLIVKDARTGKIKFRAMAENGLIIGAIGGDVEDILKKNIQDLINEYKKSVNS